ncbi:MAG: hypothetical protein AAGB10_05200 [Pseudomonadota bacterium]
MRFIVLAFVGLAACSPVETDPQSRAASCFGWYQVYDRELLRQPAFIPFAVRGETVRRTDNAPQAVESALRQSRCITFRPNLPNPPVQLPRPGTGEAASDQYIHLTTAATDRSAQQIADVVAEQGYPVRLRGVPRLGRRVYIGPLKTTDDQVAAIEYARALGFAAAYPVTRIP